MEGNFIKTQPFQFKESVPAVIGMDISKVQPYSNNIAKEIGDTLHQFVKKTEAVEQANGVAQLKSRLNDLENEYRLNVLSNPTAFDTEENRASAAKQYNDIIEKKKQLLLDSQGKFTKEQYFDLTDYMKTQTVNTITNSQSKINQGYIMQNTSMVNVNNDKLLESLQLTDDPREQDSIVGTMMSNLETLRGLGVDVEPMQLKLIGTAQETLINREIYDKIINNTDNEEFYATDKDGKIIYIDPDLDDEGRPIKGTGTIPKIDLKKKVSALYALKNSFLSDGAIKDQASQISKMTKIKEQDAFNFIKNDRNGNWNKLVAKIKSDIDYKSQIQNDMELKAANVKRTAAEETAKSYANGNNIVKLQLLGKIGNTAEVLNEAADKNNPDETRTTLQALSEGYLINTSDAWQKNYVIDLLSNKSKDYANSMKEIRTVDDVQTFADTLKFDPEFDKTKQSPNDLLMKSYNISSELKDNSVNYKLINDALFDSENNPMAAQDLADVLGKPRIELNPNMANISKKGLFKGLNGDEIQAMMKIMVANPQYYNLPQLAGSRTDQDKIDDIINAYDQKDNPEFYNKANALTERVKGYYRVPKKWNYNLPDYTTSVGMLQAQKRGVSSKSAQSLTGGRTNYNEYYRGSIAVEEATNDGQFLEQKPLTEGIKTSNRFSTSPSKDLSGDYFMEGILNGTLSEDEEAQFYVSTSNSDNSEYFNGDNYMKLISSIVKNIDNDTLNYQTVGDNFERFLITKDPDVIDALKRQRQRQKRK